MDIIIKALKKAAFFLGLHVPDVVNHDMSSEVEETSEERKSRFAELVAVEEDVKEEAANDAALISSIQDEDDMWETIDEFFEDGKKVNAIKAYRELTGADLKASKDAVDARWATLGEEVA